MSYPYPPAYFSDPSSSSYFVNDPGMISGYNPYCSTSTTLDNNYYSGNPGWDFTYPNQPIPPFDPCSGNPGWGSTYPNQPYQQTASVDPYYFVSNSAMVTKPDHNAYFGNTCGYPSLDDEAPSFDSHCNGKIPGGFFIPYASTASDSATSDTGSDASAASKRKNKNKERWTAVWLKIMTTPPNTRPHLLETYFICIDGYFREGRKGGHGVIIFNKIGQPVVASAVASSPASFLYHQLQGVCRGVQLAKDRGYENVRFFCNAKHVARLVNQAMESLAGCTLHTGDKASIDVICKACVEQHAKEDTNLIFPLLEQAAMDYEPFEKTLRIYKVPRKFNKAADFLAKNGASDRVVMEPEKFPVKLKEIICYGYQKYDNYGLPAYF